MSNTENTFTIPNTALQPQNGRILVISTIAKEVMTKSKIIKLAAFSQEKEGDKQDFEVMRYFVAAIADDVNLFVKTGFKKRKLKRGDEIQPFINPDALKWNFPIIIDFDNENYRFIVLHESEVAVINGNIPEVKESDN